MSYSPKIYLLTAQSGKIWTTSADESGERKGTLTLTAVGAQAQWYQKNSGLEVGSTLIDTIM